MEALTRPSFVATLALAVAPSCAPSVTQIVEQHHHREGLCALRSVSEEDAERIRSALVADLDPRVQVSYFEVPPSTAHASRFHGVRVHVATNAVPVDTLSVMASSDSRGAASTELYSLSKITGETIPSSRTVGPGVGEGLVIGILAVATLGILRIQPSRSRTEYPSDAEIRHAAPVAWELSHAITSGCAHPAAEGVAVRCTFAFLVRDDAPDPLAVDLAVTMGANPESRDRCSFTKQARLSLGPAASLAQELPRAYPGFVPLRDVERAR